MELLDAVNFQSLITKKPSWTKAFQQTKEYHSPYTGQHAQTAAIVAALLRMALPPAQSQEQDKHALRKHPRALHAALKEPPHGFHSYTLAPLYYVLIHKRALAGPTSAQPTPGQLHCKPV